MRSARMLGLAVLLAAAASAGVSSCLSSSQDPATGDGGSTGPQDTGPDPPIDGAVVDAGAAFVCPLPASSALVPKRALRVLFFTKETLFFHTEAHDAGETTIPAALRAHGHEVVVTSDVETFTDASLARFDVIVFFVTSGKILVDEVHRHALVSFVHAGKGIAAAHTATTNDLDWVDERGRYFMDELLGAAFKGHGQGPAQITEAGLLVDDASALTSFLPRPWIREDEWYYWFVNPATRPAVHTVVWLDESWLEPYGANYAAEGRYGDAGHPISWTKEFECARVFYTAMGHSGTAWTEEPLIRHFVAGIEWAGAPASERQ